jgi:predicted phage terminase large subunit-like protein
MLTRVQQMQKRAEKLREAARPSPTEQEPLPLLEFIPRISPRYEKPLHLTPLIERLERIPEEPQFLIVSVPPRHSKSETLLHFIAHYLSRYPSHRIAYCSYAQTFSETQAIKAHRYAKAAGINPDERMANRKDWQTSRGGGIFATGVGGEFTGRGADLLVIDDPVSNREQADSPTYREKTWAWFEDVAETRLEPGASVIVLMTRWHEDDLTGRLVRHRPDYQLLRIPALADGFDALGKVPAVDPLGRGEGEALWPARYGRDVLEKIREQKPYTFASLYQGLPRPREGRLLQDPTHYQQLPESYRTVIGADLAYSSKRYADHSAVVVYAVTVNEWFVRHVERWQADISDSLARLERLQTTYGGPIRVEGNGPQKAVVDLLKAKRLRVESVNRVADKYTEAQAFAEAWNAGRVKLPDPETLPAPWYAGFVEELLNFTGINDASDDMVDAAVNAYQEDKAPQIFV